MSQETRYGDAKAARPADADAGLDTLYGRMTKIFVPHPKFQEVFEEVRAAIELHGDGDDDELPCLHIGGPPGAGKTTLLKKLAREYPVRADARRIPQPGMADAVADAVPVLLVEVPPQPTVISVAQAMLKKLGDPFWNKGGRSNLEDRVDLLLDRCGTRAVVFDEGQRAIDRTGTVVKADLADWFKKRHAQANVVLVFVGLGRLDYLFKRDDQIKRRWDAPLRLPPYGWLNADGSDNIEDQEVFIGIVAAFARLSPLPFSPDLDVEQEDEAAALRAAMRFYYASQGLVGLLKKLMKHAMRIAMRAPARHTRIGLGLLREAFEKGFRYKDEGMVNPFGPDWDGQAPPPVQDDTLLLEVPKRRRRRATASERRRELVEALTKR